MTYSPQFLTLADDLPVLRPSADSHPRQVTSRAASIWQRLRALVTTMADRYAAATAYEQLCRLSDAELQRRGLSRATLARDIRHA